MMRSRKLEDDQQRIFRLLVIADEASKTEPSELAALERELHVIVAACVGELAEGSSGGPGRGVVGYRASATLYRGTKSRVEW